MNRTPGVSPRSPPRSLPFLTLSAAKRAKIDGVAQGESQADELPPAQTQTQGTSVTSTLTPAQLDVLTQLLDQHKAQKSNPIDQCGLFSCISGWKN